MTAERGTPWTIWLGLLGAPLAFALLLSVSYALVPWACVEQRGFVLHAVSALAVAVGIFAGWTAWRAWREESTKGGDPIAERRRFLALSAVLLSAFFLLVILVLEIPNLILEPCW